MLAPMSAWPVPSIGTVYTALEQDGYGFQHSLQEFRGLDGQLKLSGVGTKSDGIGNWWWGQTVKQLEEKVYLDKVHWDIDLSNAASVLTTDERSKQAIENAEQKLRDSPDDLEARFARANAHYLLGNDNEALKDLDVFV